LVVFVTRTEVHIDQVHIAPSSEERFSVSTGTFLVVLLIVIVLAGICLTQKDCFYRTETEDEEDVEDKEPL